MHNGCYTLILSILWLLPAGLTSQVEIVRYYHPVFSPTHTEQAAGERGVIRALVVGIDQYQNARLNTRQHARRDAEAFTAFLRTPAGGSVRWSDLVLHTDQQATLAAVTEALNWMVEESKMGDKIIVFLSVFGKLDGQKDAKLLFHDAPQAATDAGYLSLSALTNLLGQAAKEQKARVFLALDLQPVRTDKAGLIHWNKNGLSNGLHTDKWLTNNTSAVVTRGKSSYGNNLLQALLGLADLDQDERVLASELRTFLRTDGTPADSSSHCAMLAFSNSNAWVCNTSQRTRDKLAQKKTPGGTPILKLEVQPLDDFMARKADPHTLKLYEDFVLSIRLGRLLSPPGFCAADLLDSLLQVPTLQPVYRSLKRRMAVAYQDEAQQAINAYLQASIKELDRRRDNPDYYKRYAQYIRQTQQLLSKNHFMAPLLELKRLYFEALEIRLEFEQTNNPGQLPEAMAKLWQALSIEAEAAFVYNEMGVIAEHMNQLKTAEDFFNKALTYAPTWGIPCSNLSLVLFQQGRSDEAINTGIEAISLSPWNPHPYSILGQVYHDNKQFKEAAAMFRRALLLDPQHANTHYNMACAKARQGDSGAALEALRKAMRYGFDQVEHMRTDPDLKSLHNTKGFKKLLAGK